MMTRSVVFDCNVFLQAMISAHGPANACWQKVVSGEIRLLVAPFVLAELRDLPHRKKLRKLSNFTSERVEVFIDDLLNVAHLVADPDPIFVYPRDPDDAHYVDLAIATGAMLVVSNDKDLLDLMSETNQEGCTLRGIHPSFQVMTPPTFLRILESEDRE